MIKLFLVFAALNGALAVALGAFGAHALKQSLSAEALQIWQTAVHYHFVHLLALLALGFMLKTKGASFAGLVSGVAFIIGIILFCGSLYALALGGPRWLGPITPLGGLSFIVGWLALTVTLWKIAQ